MSDESVSEIEARVKAEMLASGEYIRNPFKGLADTINRMARVRRETPEGPTAREARSQRDLRRAIAAERRLGLAHVRSEARRVQKELFGEVL